MDIKILADNSLERTLPISRLRALAEQVLAAQGIDPDTELTLVITDQEKVRELNKDYAGKDEPSDVLAFALQPVELTPENRAFLIPKEGVWRLGEVVVSYPQAVARAEQHHRSLEKELACLITRGVLYLLGYGDHRAERRLLSTKEAEILDCLDVD